jgi:ABC-type sugar transport system ATPase subunit
MPLSTSPSAREGHTRCCEAATFPAVVDVVEYLGDEQLVHLRSGEIDLVAKLPVDPRLTAGQSVTLGVPAEKLYLFDPVSELALDIVT